MRSESASLCTHYSGLFTGCSLRSVSAIGPRRAGATAGSLPPILHRSPVLHAQPGDRIPAGKMVSCRQDRLARSAEADSGADAAPSPSTSEEAVPVASAAATRTTPAEKVLWPAPGRLGKAVMMNRLHRMPLAPRLAPRWRTGSAAPVWIAVLPGERAPACASARRYISLSDCLRAVPQSNNLSFEYRYLPASFAPRPRLERGTYCLGGTPETWPGVAGCGLTCRSAGVIIAGRGLAWPRACGRWLPVRLPTTSLATLMFE